MIETPGESAPKTVTRRSTARLRLRPADQAALKVQGQSDAMRLAEANQISLLSVKTTMTVAILTSIVTLVVALFTVVNGRNQSAEEFQREQRQKAYSEFLASASALDMAEVETWSKTQITPGDSPGSAELEAVADASADLALKLAVVRLIAPSDTAYDAVAVLGVLTSRGIVAARALDEPGGPDIEAETQYEEYQRKYTDLTEKFLESARGDLN